MSKIKNSDPRILIFGAVTIIMVLFAFYMAAKSITTEHSSPEYRKTPPKAFALPIAELIVDPGNLETPRLPDEAYIWIFDVSKKLSKQMSNQTLTVNSLMKFGMGKQNAKNTLGRVKSSYNIFGGRKIKLHGSPSLGSTSTRSASVSQAAMFGPSVQGDPGGTFTISYGFVSGNGVDWKLNRIEIDV